MKKILSYCIVIAIMAFATNMASAQVSVSIQIGPPVLPVYEQPLCPTDGYIWEPGYWAYGDDGYYWVPGTWVLPPQYGYYWTPGYWAFSDGYYGWHPGYWGPHVGYYGGINYGFGYVGHGYYGGEWSGRTFRYNTAVTRVNTTIVHNTYVNKTVINNTTVVNNRASFNGQGGVNARPTPQEQTFEREKHIQATKVQLAHEAAARSDKNQFASVNHGRPQTMAVERPRATVAKATTANTHTVTRATRAAINNHTTQSGSTANTTNSHQPVHNSQRIISNKQVHNAPTQQAQVNQTNRTNKPTRRPQAHTNMQPSQVRTQQHVTRPAPMAMPHQQPAMSRPQEQPHGEGGGGNGREKK